MKRFLAVMIIALISTSTFASGGMNQLKKRIADDDITEVYQLCDQLGVDAGTTIEVEQCANEDQCVVIKVDCTLVDELQR
jgi:outer membrane murein-binding lipoprotein Lpp